MHRPDKVAAFVLLEHAPVGMAACDDQGQVVWVNATLCAMTGEEAGELVSRSGDQLLGTRVEQVDATTRRAVVSGADGERRWLEQRVSTLAMPVTGIAAVLSVADISAFQSRARSRAAVAAGIEASRLDADTGLLNRRATMQELNAQVSRSRRYGNPLSLLGVRVSDECEDADGSLRRRVAQHLRESLRWVDSAGALDAETLVVVLPETDLESARHVAQKLGGALLADSECSEVSDYITVTSWVQPDDVGALLERVREPRYAIA